MAQQFPVFPNNRGTLAPGQIIDVNKHTVQVERYLSQGGFAHVYLVRTNIPVYDTTKHVLKRIAVANDAMLTEVKKEVDIMRILKGHPNIVCLIDAAWNRMANGTYEVFILMEFCAGGGIIDMMNRRLRERLTEAEILTIFADVCEGVAAMHNLRPALLHRDLKVENILQASASSYKLCDFGSATTVSQRPPSTMQEIRALEADLSQHTTLQYRAPEMVDPYLRRPVDEKSDVWALGVLLYKLCYYTTPFEEHGPLAILNVQYKIPTYPIYSKQMNSLIDSMLQEHGAHRPTIFQILKVVHQIRGTRSRFSYNVPEKPLLPPRPVGSSKPKNLLDSLVTVGPSKSSTPSKNAGTQARDKVLEAIAPMRRGRPMREVSRSPSPEKGKVKNKRSTELKGWKAGALSSEQRGDPTPTSIGGSPAVQGFDDSFDILSFVSSSSGPTKLGSVPNPVRSSQEANDPASSQNSNRSSVLRNFKPKDAFDGLGLFEKPPAPTLGEVRKARTGLALPLEHSFTPRRRSPQPPNPPQPLLHPQLSEAQPQNQSLMDRFPSIEELDRRILTSGKLSPLPNLQSKPDSVTVATNPGYRSQNVSGIGMRESNNELPRRREELPSSSISSESGVTLTPQRIRPTRPSLTRKHRSYIAMKPVSSELEMGPKNSSPSHLLSQPQPTLSSSSQRRDWLTGDNDAQTANILLHIDPKVASMVQNAGNEPGAPVLRDSPSKRASFFEKSPHLIAEPLQGDVDQGSLLPPLVLLSRPSSSTAISAVPTIERSKPPALATDSLRTGNGGLTDNWSPIAGQVPISSKKGISKSSSTSDSEDDDEGPEDVDGYRSLRYENQNNNVNRRKKSIERSKRRQSSVHDLVDLWGGSSLLNKEKEQGINHNAGIKKDNPRNIGPSSTSAAIVSLTGSSIPSSLQPTLLSSQTFPEKSLLSSPFKESSKDWTKPNITDANASNLSTPRQPASSTSSSLSGLHQHKSRPKSMVVFPSTKSVIDSSRTAPVLGAPPETTATLPISRRPSISNMVQRFDGLSIGASQSNNKSELPSPSPPKPLALNPSTGDTFIGFGSSNTRYTKILQADPPAKLATNESLSVPVAQSNISAGGSRRTSPIGLPSRVSPRISATTFGPESTSTAIASWQDSNPDGEPKAPSPEKPYAGVSQLIQQWQMKANEFNIDDAKRGGVNAKRYGVANGSAR